MARLQRGKVHIEQTPEITDIREVTRADLAHLTTPRQPHTLQTLRDNHHRIARALASGLGVAETAATCGVSITRVSTLRNDPAFEELIAHYRGIITAEWAQQDVVIEYMRTNALKAQAMLSDKLDDFADRNEFLPTRDLVAIAELGLDRTGYGKVNKNVNVNVDFAARLESALQRSDRAREIRAIDGQASPPLAPRSEPAPVNAPQRAPAPPLRRI